MLNPKVFVSTYKKYNEGRLEGEWLSLDEFDSYGEFIEYCRNLHSDEVDPEFMFQDWEDIPEQFISESHIDKELWDWLDLDDYERFITKLYWDKLDDSADVQNILANYYGEFDSFEEFGRHIVNELFYDAFKKYPDLKYYFNYTAYVKDILINYFVAAEYDHKSYIFHRF